MRGRGEEKSEPNLVKREGDKRPGLPCVMVTLDIDDLTRGRFWQAKSAFGWNADAQTPLTYKSQDGKRNDLINKSIRRWSPGAGR